jgi:cysteine-rich repeat protein
MADGGTESAPADARTDSGSDGADTTPVPANLCGNDTIDPGETCDNGNQNKTGPAAAYGTKDDCNDKCQRIPHCGDGTPQRPREECDNGNRNGQAGCSATCTVTSLCGNGVIDPGEDCDNIGENKGTETYSKTITAPRADGKKHCNASCKQVQFCGDGAASNGETCDKGKANKPSGQVYGTKDDCSATCKPLEFCGDKILQPAREICDPKEGLSPTAATWIAKLTGPPCNLTCEKIRFCGDGTHDTGPGTQEACDEGDKNGTGPATCTRTCEKKAADGTPTPPAPPPNAPQSPIEIWVAPEELRCPPFRGSTVQCAVEVVKNVGGGVANVSCPTTTTPNLPPNFLGQTFFVFESNVVFTRGEIALVADPAAPKVECLKKDGALLTLTQSEARTWAVPADCHRAGGENRVRISVTTPGKCVTVDSISLQVTPTP